MLTKGKVKEWLAPLVGQSLRHRGDLYGKVASVEGVEKAHGDWWARITIEFLGPAQKGQQRTLDTKVAERERVFTLSWIRQGLGYSLEWPETN